MYEQTGPFVVIYKTQPHNNNSSGFHKVQDIQSLYEFLTQFSYKYIVPLQEQNNQKTITFAEIIKFLKSLPYCKIFKHTSTKKGSVMQSVSMEILRGYRRFMRQRAQQAEKASQLVLQKAQGSALKQQVLRIINNKKQNTDNQMIEAQEEKQ